MKKKAISLKEGSVPSLIIRLAIPNTLGLLVISAYSLADSFFLASLGATATAAVGVTFSLHVLMQAVGYTLGMGAGALLSRALGHENDVESASRFASVAFFLSLSIGILIAVTGFFAKVPILRFLGADGDVLTAAKAYVTPLFLSAPFMCASFVLSQLLRAEGRAVYAMVGLMTGSLLNIALDPLLISVFRFGIAGASTATLISQGVGLFVLLSAYVGKRKTVDVLKIKLSYFAFTGKILLAGLPSLLRQGLSGGSSVLLNRAAAEIGGGALSAISLVTRLFLLVFAFCLGLGQAMIPIVGYSLGADDPARMKKAYFFSTAAASLVMLFFSVPLFFFATPILKIFGAATEALPLGTLALRAQAVALALHGTITCTILFLQVTGRPFAGSLLASARQGLFFLPLIFLLPARLGGTGLALTQPLADALTFLLALPFMILSLRSLTKKASATRNFA